MRTASEHFTTCCIVDFLHLYDHLSVARVIKGDVEVVVVQIDGIDKGFYQPLLAITVCHVRCGHVMQEKQNHISRELKAPGKTRLSAGHAEGLFLVCQFIHAGFRHLIDDTHFDGFHHIG